MFVVAFGVLGWRGCLGAFEVDAFEAAGNDRRVFAITAPGEAAGKEADRGAESNGAGVKPGVMPTAPLPVWVV